MRFIPTLYDENGKVIETEICPKCKGDTNLHVVSTNGKYRQICTNCTMAKADTAFVETKVKEYSKIWQKQFKNKICETVVLDLTEKNPQIRKRKRR